MRTLRRLGHLGWSLLVAAWFTLTRRGATMLFTHYPDLDASGVDRQMGPLVDALRRSRRPFVEVTFVPLGALTRNWRQKRRLFISYASLHAVARLIVPRWAPRPAQHIAARTRAARLLLRLLRPARIVLIDESASGQPLVRAAKQLGIPTIGVQHGDFHADNGAYVPQVNASFDVVPVDLFCVWSDWFRERLIRRSPIYDADNTRVTGRLRQSPTIPQTTATRARVPGRLEILLVSEATPAFRDRVKPFLAALSEAPGVRLTIQPHPAEPVGRWSDFDVSSRPLTDALARCDVVIGVRSSALLEAIHFGRPVVLLGDDPAVYARPPVAEVCEIATDLVARCRAAAACPLETIEQTREHLWGGDAVDPVESILGSCGIVLPTVAARTDTLG